MINILLDGMSLTEDYLADLIRRLLRPEHQVAVVAFSFRDSQASCLGEWNGLYGKEIGIYYNAIVASFEEVGICEENITFVNYFSDSREAAAEKIRNADIIYFPGGLSDRMMERIREFELENVLRQHSGIVMGFSAGAYIQLKEYDLSPDEDYPEFGYYEGLAFLQDFYLEAHYENSPAQNAAIQRVLRERRKPVYAFCCNRGAIIVENGNVMPLGDVKIFLPEGEEV